MLFPKNPEEGMERHHLTEDVTAGIKGLLAADDTKGVDNPTHPSHK